ncbi:MULTISPECIES: TerC family protein [Myroides]|uniref:TerC family protein n=1 Tax=Myroides albus TaxID=2562892 RepID=A0A6I3LJ46_9FLAO|nr:MULTISPECIES: TerC family protein [Myroides]MTG98608.1 TerC family protein [Myroides albus]MVX35878.1 TerC family protein [Myroides sp. LoEW2-1]UVD79978.1 TerC family protein [Myroides albus]
MEVLFTADAIVAFITLTFLEIVLGIDNVIFISIVTGKLPENQRKKATQIGLFLAMFMRIALLFGVSWLIAMKKPLFSIDWGWFSASFNGQALILLLGGIFLIYKSTKEIHEKVSHVQHNEPVDEKDSAKKIAVKSFGNILIQILMIDIIFSIDSILTAVGMTNGIQGALYIMIAAVIVSVAVMMIFAVPVGNFVNRNPSIQILALSFLILIGFMLTTESMHISHAVLAGQEVGAVPKGYLYFAIAFSLVVEFINMKIRRKTT